MYIDEFKIFARNEIEREKLILTIEIYSPNIGIEFDCEIYTMLIMKKEKIKAKEELELRNQESIKTLKRKGKLHVLGNIGRVSLKRDERKCKQRIS